MSETIKLLDLGISPEAGVSDPILIQTDFFTTLLFNSVRKEGERYVPAGRAILNFKNCSITKFGYPNDEARWAIPRTKGLSYDAYEIYDSEWSAELDRLNRLAFPNFQRSGKRHFLILFHDSSFECLAEDVSVILSEDPTNEILGRICNDVGED